jgi:serine/threonine protein kinase
MHLMNYVYFNYHINIRILYHFIKYLIYQVKRFLFLNSKLKKISKISNEFCFVYSAKQGDLQLALELEGCLEEIQAIHVTKQILDAVAFLHDNKIVHLDIKVISEN